jgi:hypothetical protein
MQMSMVSCQLDLFLASRIAAASGTSVFCGSGHEDMNGMLIVSA